jgi:hypothetical protein
MQSVSDSEYALALCRTQDDSIRTFLFIQLLVIIGQ